MKKSIIIGLFVFVLAGIASCTTNQTEMLNDDFYYTNKTQNFTIYLGMKKDDFLAVAGNQFKIHGNEYYFEKEKLTLKFENGILIYIDQHMNLDDDNDFGNWEFCKGINIDSTINEIISALGEPTYKLIDGIPYFLNYDYYPIGEGKYKKVNGNDYNNFKESEDYDKYEEFINSYDQANEMIRIHFYLSRNSKGKMNFCTISYPFLDGYQDRQ